MPGNMPQKVSLPVSAGLVLCLLAVGVAFAADAAEPQKDFSGQPAYQVVRVIDGDTIEVERDGRKEKVRYIGINAPELHESFGFKASRANRELVESRTVRFEFDEQRRDQHGRTLAYVFVQPAGQPQWIMVNAELLRRGFACVTTYPPNLRYQEHFGRRQDEARKGRFGLWADPGAVAQMEVVQLREYLGRVQARNKELWALVKEMYEVAREGEAENKKLRAENKELVAKNKAELALNKALVKELQRLKTAKPGAPRPAPALGTSAIESKVDSFDGWEGETIIKLTNGQIWQQAEPHYEYHYAYWADVLVYPSAGGWKMWIEGSDKAVRVERLK